ncbi:hypothetical protein NECID01_0013 [Nematocida sp. AWRm77]|nr:hypothetical protein NECID01_0013 [Nematocida sp. AWRm77]
METVELPTATPEKKHRSKKQVTIMYMVIYFFIHLVLYSSHNYRETLFETVFRVDKNNYFYVEMMSGLKLVATVMYPYMCKGKLRPLLLSALCTGMFMVSLTLLILNVFENQPVKVFLGVMYLVSDAVILPTIDSECLCYLSRHETTSKFSKIRIFAAIGQALIYPTNYGLQRYFGDVYGLDRAILTSTNLFGCFALMCFARLLLITEPSHKASVHKTASSSSIWSVFSPLRSPSYLIIMLCTLGIGISRTSFQSYLTTYLQKTRTNKNEHFLIYFLRTVLEMFVWSIVIWLKERVSLEFLFPLSLLLGSLRCLLYTINFSNPHVLFIVPYAAEMLKSVFSSLFIYVTTRLAFKYSDANAKTFALSGFTGVYSGLAPFIAGVLSYSIFYGYIPVQASSREEKIKVLFSTVGWIGIGATVCGAYFYLKNRPKRSVIMC